MKSFQIRSLVVSCSAILIALMTLVIVNWSIVAEVKPVQAAAFDIVPLDSRASQVVTQVYVPLVTRFYDSQTPVFGLQMYGALSAQLGFTRVLESKAGWVRIPILWASIEPTQTTPDNYNWAAADAALANVSPVELIVTIAQNPPWASSTSNGPVNDLEDFKEFIGAVVARYPTIRYWELYNEPDNVAFFGTSSGAAAYAAMLKAAYPIIKAANPNAQVLMGGVAMDWFTDDDPPGPFSRTFVADVLHDCQYQACFDIANFHYYPLFRNRWESYGRDIAGKTAYLRQLLATYEYTRPVVATETSWPSTAWGGSAEWQARYVAKAYVRGVAADLATIVWYSVRDEDSSGAGLLTVDLTPRPAYTAFRTLTTMLNKARFVRTIPVTETGSAFIEAYQFMIFTVTGPKRVDVYWYECPSMSQYASVPTDCDNVAPLRIAAASVAKIDKLGNRTIVDDTDDGYHDGLVTLGVLSSPIYIDYQP